jgi:RND family efflux transporter MFP subunit
MVALVTTLVVTAACSRQSDSGGDKSEESKLVAEVTVTKVERAGISTLLSVSGTIAAVPNSDVKVSSLVAGRVASMTVSEGDHVKKDQELALIDPRPYHDQLQQAEALVAQANATLENARLNRTRNENLFERGIAARKDVDDARMQQSVSEAVLRQAEAARALARLQVTRTRILSPLDGTVVKRLVSVGEQVDGTGAQPIFEVVNLSEVELFGNVPAVYLGKIKVGQSLPISTDAFPDTKFTGRVVAVSPAVDPATSLGLVRIRMANAGGRLRWGMFLMAQIPLETHADALIVPPQAVYRDEKGQTLVYRVEGNAVKISAVTMGLETQERVELLSGASAGDTVILEGGYGLPDGAHIKVKK